MTIVIARKLLVGVLTIGILASAFACTESDLDLIDPEHECALCPDKADQWNAPTEGSCEAQALLAHVNRVSISGLDARFDHRITYGIGCVP